MLQRNSDTHAAQRRFSYKQRPSTEQGGAFTHVVNARHGRDKFRSRKITGNGVQLIGGIEPDGPAVFPARGQKPRLVLFQRDRKNAADRAKIEKVSVKDRPDGRFDGVRRRASAAADADAQLFRDQAQRLCKGAFLSQPM